MFEKWRERLNELDDERGIVHNFEPTHAIRPACFSDAVEIIIRAFDNIFEYPEAACQRPRIAHALERILHIARNEVAPFAAREAGIILEISIRA